MSPVKVESLREKGDGGEKKDGRKGARFGGRRWRGSKSRRRGWGSRTRLAHSRRGPRNCKIKGFLLLFYDEQLGIGDCWFCYLEFIHKVVLEMIEFHR